MIVLPGKYCFHFLLVLVFPFVLTAQTTSEPATANRINYGIGFGTTRLDGFYCPGLSIGFNVRMRHMQLGIDLAGYSRNTGNTYGYQLVKPGLALYHTCANGQYIVPLSHAWSLNPSLTTGFVAATLSERNVDYVSAKHPKKSTAHENYFTLLPGMNVRYQFDWGGAIVLSAGYQRLYGRAGNDFSRKTGNEGWVYGVGFEIDLNE